MQLEIVVEGDYVCITQTVALGHLLPVVVLGSERPLAAADSTDRRNTLVKSFRLRSEGELSNKVFLLYNHP